jgi:hypothetical protein
MNMKITKNALSEDTNGLLSDVSSRVPSHSDLEQQHQQFQKTSFVWSKRVSPASGTEAGTQARRLRGDTVSPTGVELYTSRVANERWEHRNFNSSSSQDGK